MSDAATETDIQLPTKGSKIVPLLLAVNSVALVGVLAVVLMRGGGSNEAKAAPAAAEGEAGAEGSLKGLPGPTIKLSDFTARLRGGETERYARISLEVEVATEKDKEEFAARVPQLRDAFIRYFSDLKLEDVTGSAAIEKTKSALDARLHEVVPGKAVRSVYITDLVVQ